MQISITITRVTASSLFFTLHKPLRPHAGKKFYVWKSYIEDYGTIGKEPKVGTKGYMSIKDLWYQSLHEYTPDQTDINKVIDGLMLLRKYYPDAEVGVNRARESVTVGSPMDPGSQSDITAQDQENLARLGWLFDDRDGGWYWSN
jgi:hypothetical protein